MADRPQRRYPDLPTGDLWVFGYGSLMWQPGFDFAESSPARVYGYRRALCLWSMVYRGTPARPGLVFGLAPGGSCRGRAFRVHRGARPAVLEYLWQREMVRQVYLPTLLRLHLDGATRAGLAFVVDTTHPQFVDHLSDEQAAAVIARSRGRGGTNREYFIESLAHLEEMEVSTRRFEGVRRRLGVGSAPP